MYPCICVLVRESPLRYDSCIRGNFSALIERIHVFLEDVSDGLNGNKIFAWCLSMVAIYCGELG